MNALWIGDVPQSAGSVRGPSYQGSRRNVAGRPPVVSSSTENYNLALTPTRR